MRNCDHSPYITSHVEVLTAPGVYLDQPARLLDAWLAAKEAQGHPIPPERLARLTPAHMIDRRRAYDRAACMHATSAALRRETGRPGSGFRPISEILSGFFPDGGAA